MKPEEEFLKRDLQKKKKKRSRFARFVVFLILFLAVITLVFTAISNPGFFNGVKQKLLSFYTSGEKQEIQSGTTSEFETETAGNGTPSGREQLTQENNSQKPEEESGGSFWERIIGFFKNKIQEQAEDFPISIKIKCYFASLGEEEKFVYEERTIAAGSAKTAVENAVKELLKGPAKTFHYPVIPPGTELSGVEIYENIAKIDFSQEFLENSLESGILDEYVIYTIVNTVTQVPKVEGVIFLIDGKRIKTYGNVDLSIPAIINEKYLNIQQ